METIRYEDAFIRIIDITQADGRIVARRVIFRNEFGGVEKEYHKVFSSPLPIKRTEGREE